MLGLGLVREKPHRTLCQYLLKMVEFVQTEFDLSSIPVQPADMNTNSPVPKEDTTQQNNVHHDHHDHGHPESSDTFQSSLSPSYERQFLFSGGTFDTNESPDAKHFLRSTSARGNYQAAWLNYLKEKEAALSPPKVKKVDTSYVLPEGLMKLTQSRINERKKLGDIIAAKSHEEDILRKFINTPPKTHSNPRSRGPVNGGLMVRTDNGGHDGSPSGNHSPTNGALNEQHLATPNNLHYEGHYYSPFSNSKLLQTTESFEHSKWHAVIEHRSASPPRSAHRPNVKSAETKGKRSKSSSPCRTAKVSSSSPDIKTTPSKLFTLNAAMIAKQREKLIKPQPDLRETGWNQFHHKI